MALEATHKMLSFERYCRYALAVEAAAAALVVLVTSLRSVVATLLESCVDIKTKLDGVVGSE